MIFSLKNLATVKMITILVTLAFGLLLVGCNKDSLHELNELNLTTEAKEERIDFYKSISNGIKVIESEKLGNYLSFSSKENYDSISEYLEGDSLDIEELKLWSSIFNNFNSTLHVQVEKNIPFSKWMPSDFEAATLNENGYIEIEGVMYQKSFASEKGETIYKVNKRTHEKEELNFKKSTQRSYCLPYSGSDTYRQSNGFMLKGQLLYSSNYWGYERVYLKAWTYISSGAIRAYTNMTFSCNYDYTDRGAIKRGSFQEEYYGYYKSRRIARGWNICMKDTSGSIYAWYNRYSSGRVYVDNAP